MAKSPGLPVPIGPAPQIYIKNDILDGIRKALEDLHKTKGTNFHLAWPVGEEGAVGDVHFTIKQGRYTSDEEEI